MQGKGGWRLYAGIEKGLFKYFLPLLKVNVTMRTQNAKKCQRQLNVRIHLSKPT